MERHAFNWRNLEVEVLFESDWSPVYREVYGYALGHLQIRCLNGKPLPFSDTGYQSHFERADSVQAFGGPPDYVRQWLEHAAQERTRQSQQPDPRQLALF